MAEPPRLRVQFDARQKVIPLLFDKHCKQGYILKVIPPEIEKDPKPGPIARPTFQVLDQVGELVAFFNPWGGGECKKEEFKSYFDRLKTEIEKAAKEALADFEGY
jgi:hypothetical protein